MKKAAFIAAATAALLSGCPTMQVAPPDKSVTVTVISAKGIAVSMEPIYVDTKDTRIIWNLATSGYEFAANGIEVINGGSEFDCSRQSGVVFICIDHYTRPAKYKYVIRVNGTGGAANPAALDPTIVND